MPAKRKKAKGQKAEAKQVDYGQLVRQVEQAIASKQQELRLLEERTERVRQELMMLAGRRQMLLELMELQTRINGNGANADAESGGDGGGERQQGTGSMGPKAG